MLCEGRFLFPLSLFERILQKKQSAPHFENHVVWKEKQSRARRTAGESAVHRTNALSTRTGTTRPFGCPRPWKRRTRRGWPWPAFTPWAKTWGRTTPPPPGVPQTACPAERKGGRGALPNIIFDDGSAVYYSGDGREVLIHLNCASATPPPTPAKAHSTGIKTARPGLFQKGRAFVFAES